MLSTVPCHCDVRISVDRHRNGLPSSHIGHLRFLRFGLHPGVIGGDQVKRRHRGGEILAGRDGRHIGDDAGEGRPHHGMVKLALRFVDLRLGLQVLRMLRRLDIGIAAKPGQLRRRLLPQRLQACSCH